MEGSLQTNSSPPSSSPGTNDEEPATKRLASPRRKRSHDNMTADVEDAFPSSATMTGDVTSSAPRASTPDQSDGDGVKPSTAAHSNLMMPPPPPTSQLSSSQEAPTSAQLPAKPTSKPKPATANASTLQQDEASPSPEDDEAGTQDISDLSEDPQERLPDFEWQDLHQRYHDRMTELDGQEKEAMKDFNQLCEYFAVWADAGSRREVDRSFKRLKTQTAYVQHEEELLEERRQHYIRVVDAFKSALELLR